MIMITITTGAIIIHGELIATTITIGGGTATTTATGVGIDTRIITAHTLTHPAMRTAIGIFRPMGKE